MSRHYITPDELNKILEKNDLIYENQGEYFPSVIDGTPLNNMLSQIVNEVNAKVITSRDTPKMETWATRDYSHREGDLKVVSLKKSVLGEFMYHLLQFGGVLRGTYVMDKNFKGSFVELLIELPEGTKDEFMKISGFQLRKPSTLSPA